MVKPQRGEENPPTSPLAQQRPRLDRRVYPRPNLPLLRTCTKGDGGRLRGRTRRAAPHFISPSAAAGCPRPLARLVGRMIVSLGHRAIASRRTARRYVPSIRAGKPSHSEFDAVSGKLAPGFESPTSRRCNISTLGSVCPTSGQPSTALSPGLASGLFLRSARHRAAIFSDIRFAHPA